MWQLVASDRSSVWDTCVERRWPTHTSYSSASAKWRHVTALLLVERQGVRLTVKHTLCPKWFPAFCWATKCPIVVKLKAFIRTILIIKNIVYIILLILLLLVVVVIGLYNNNVSKSFSKCPSVCCRSGTRLSERGSTFALGTGGHLVAMGDVVFVFQGVL